MGSSSGDGGEQMWANNDCVENVFINNIDDVDDVDTLTMLVI